MHADENKDELAGRGKTTIVDSVVAKVAGIAAREVSGVHALGGGAARALGAIREAVAGVDQTQGISTTIDQGQVAVDVVIVAEYPTPLPEVAEQVRRAIVHAIEHIVGMHVTEVNVTVNDVRQPLTEDAQPAQ